MINKVDNEKIKELMKYVPKKIKEVQRSRSSHKYDPVEDTEEYLKVKDEVDKLAQEAVGNFRGLGTCHIFWRAKKQILKEKYGIEWKCPTELNPDILFD